MAPQESACRRGITWRLLGICGRRRAAGGCAVARAAWRRQVCGACRCRWLHSLNHRAGAATCRRSHSQRRNCGYYGRLRCCRAARLPGGRRPRRAVPQRQHGAAGEWTASCRLRRHGCRRRRAAARAAGRDKRRRRRWSCRRPCCCRHRCWRMLCRRGARMRGTGRVGSGAWRGCRASAAGTAGAAGALQAGGVAAFAGCQAHAGALFGARQPHRPVRCWPLDARHWRLCWLTGRSSCSGSRFASGPQLRLRLLDCA